MAQRAGMAARLHQAWQARGTVSLALRPLSWLAHGLAVGKQLAYRRGWKRSYRSALPVVVVGNLYVGGTGKTPFLLAAIAALQARGWHPGVISRGYGVHIGKLPRTGRGRLDATQFGDEPSLIASETGVPVSVHPRRALAAQALVEQFPQVDVILSDDGLQHLALARDIEILLEDARGVGNGLMLPAGPLREPAARRERVDAIVRNVGSDALETSAQDDVACPRHVHMQVLPALARRLSDGAVHALHELGRDEGRIAAAAGIGQPERFFESLRRAGVGLAQTLSLPDHFDYAASPFEAVDAEIILITGKDAVKCADLHDPRLWVVPVSVQFSDPFFFDWLHGRLLACSRDLDTPTHGYTTA